MLRVLEGHGRTTVLAFHPREPVLASGSADGTVRLENVESGALVAEFRQQGEVRAVSFDRGGSMLAVASDETRLWDVRQARLLASLPGTAASLVFTPDGGRLLAGLAGDGTIQVWDVRSRQVIGKMVGHSGAVRSIAFSPDGSRIVSASDDATVRLWDPRTFEQMLVLRGHRRGVKGAVFTPDGSRIISWERGVRTWSTRESIRWPNRLRPEGE